MIRAVVRKQDGKYRSFRIKGHAEYADYGKDIVCAAVSMLVLNTANAIEALTENTISGREEDGEIIVELPDPPDEKGQLLIDTMLLGLYDVQKKYGKNYLKLIIEEV